MPVHDWTRVDAGLFHAFHQGWISALCDALNTGGLPPSYFALVEASPKVPIPDVLTLHLSRGAEGTYVGAAPRALATDPPRVRFIQWTDADTYADKANRITVRHRHGQVIAVIEIVSPGNKGSQAEI